MDADRNPLQSPIRLAIGLLLVGLFAWAVATSSASRAEIVDLGGRTMGTTYSVRWVNGGQNGPSVVQQEAIDQRLVELNRRMSTYDPGSELSRFNTSDSTDWFSVSAETATVVEAALKLAAETEGKYDPTVGPLVNLWGFGPGKRRDAPPSEEEIASVRPRVGYQLVAARLDPPALKKASPEVYVDLSSIAKGHGADAIANLLVDRGVQAFMVEIGGEVRTLGTKPDGQPWRIGVEKAPPLGGSGERELQRVVELAGGALATSGDYRNFFEHQGERYSHTIDPVTGHPVTHDLATVTVIADTCREADGVATALLVLGPRVGYDWAVERGFAALFVSRSEDGQLTEKTTPAWETATAEPMP